MASTIGQRLKRVEQHIGKDDVFLANYTDGLTDLPLPDNIAHFMAHDRIASFLCVTPRLSFHSVNMTKEGKITSLDEMARSGLRVNGGYFLFKRSIFEYIQDGEELVQAPFQRLIKRDQLIGYSYNGFWAAMDTFKDKMLLDDLYTRDKAPWAVWKERAKLTPPCEPPLAPPYLRKVEGL